MENKTADKPTLKETLDDLVQRREKELDTIRRVIKARFDNATEETVSSPQTIMFDDLLFSYSMLDSLTERESEKQILDLARQHFESLACSDRS